MKKVFQIIHIALLVVSISFYSYLFFSVDESETLHSTLKIIKNVILFSIPVYIVVILLLVGNNTEWSHRFNLLISFYRNALNIYVPLILSDIILLLFSMWLAYHTFFYREVIFFTESNEGYIIEMQHDLGNDDKEWRKIGEVSDTKPLSRRLKADSKHVYTFYPKSKFGNHEEYLESDFFMLESYFKNNKSFSIRVPN